MPNRKGGFGFTGTDLLGGELRGIRKNEVNRELRRDYRGRRWSRLHESKRGRGRIHVWNDFLPGIDEGGALGRIGGETGGEGANPDGEGREGGGDGGSSQEARGLAQHGGKG